MTRFCRKMDRTHGKSSTGWQIWTARSTSRRSGTSWKRSKEIPSHHLNNVFHLHDITSFLQTALIHSTPLFLQTWSLTAALLLSSPTFPCIECFFLSGSGADIRRWLDDEEYHKTIDKYGLQDITKFKHLCPPMWFELPESSDDEEQLDRAVSTQLQLEGTARPS